MGLIKTKQQIEGIIESANINTAVLDHVAAHIKAGMTTEDINKLVHDFTVAHGAIPAPLNYCGFPKSVCTSINHEVCHGIPSKDVVLKDGDIINVDVSTIYKGYFSDASRMFMIGEVSEEARKLVEVTRECMQKGIETVKPNAYLGDIGAAILAHARANGYSVVREIGGHGIGLEFHEDPYVSHVSRAGTGIRLEPGMIFTIEPMVNIGTARVREDKKNGWTIYTADNKLSAQWESMILVTEDGYKILTC
ncbi:MAG: type I methionyl aminopeptidase [Zhenhengia sp.]|jgi:methionyl aminopeptidase|uniref:type I methionyl aminopeptidase n=1 Tax=Zhenhengia sp. TaxID=2944208 RepID=UPI0029146BD6|nr:type I methionyl aminopeptidase [Clostridiales bacterium]MDU6852907.1 type I methionyl aminopeptidase [Clostridiales bacterium]MDU6972959.1 type I methionyl aminopeptidase [Clostridiales bacterium]